MAVYRSAQGAYAIAIGTILLIGMGLEKPAYSTPIYSDRNTSGDTLSALSHQSNYFAINQIDWAATCPRPCCLVEDHSSRPWFGWRHDGISENICSRGVRYDSIQRESSKGDGGSVTLHFIINDKMRGFNEQFLYARNIIDRSAFADIGTTIKHTIFREESKPTNIASAPFVQRKVNSGSAALRKWAAGEKIFNDMRGREEGSVVINEEGASVDARNVEHAWRGLIHTNDRSDRPLRLFDGINERIALGDSAAEPTQQQNQNREGPIAQTSGPVNGGVSPFVARCVVSSDKGVWNVQCPEYVYPAHTNVPLLGN